MDKKVDKYIEKQKSPQKEICQKLRKIILKTFPDIKEELKWGTPWYEGKYYIVALKGSGLYWCVESVVLKEGW